MKKTINQTVLFSLFVFLSFSLHAQFQWEMGTFVGVSNYQGDFVESNTPLFKESNFAFGILGRYNLNYEWAVRGGIVVGKITGRDLNFSDPQLKTRGGSFSNVLKELSVSMVWEPLGKKRYFSKAGGFKKLISPYGFAGVGLLSMNPKVMFTEEGAAARAERIKQDENAKYFNTRITVPFGAGVRVDLSENWSLSVEVGMRYAFTDYLDGTSIAAGAGAKDWYNFSGLTVFHRLPNTRTTFATRVKKKKKKKAAVKKDEEG